MIWLVVTFCIAVTTVAIFQRVYVALFESRTRRELELGNEETQYEPRTALVLCVRGADPSLAGCLQSIEKQSYTDFQLQVVADDSEDPGLLFVRKFAEQSSLDIRFHLIEEPGTDCSLKCSAIISAIGALESEFKVVALIDADAIVTENWLATLVAPLSHPEVGASTGNRWFRIPSQRVLGSAIRGAWNAAAVVQMYLYEIPWGGTLALRREVIENTELLDHWSRGFCEDTMLTRILHREGYQIARPVELVVVNEESTSLGGAFRWIQRQLLTVRLHHPRWALIWLHGLATGLPLIGLCLAGLCWLVGASFAMTVTLVALALFEIAAVLTMLAIVNAHQPLLERSNQFKPFQKEVFWYLVTLPLTQTVHFLATIVVTTMRSVRWRNIEYSVGRKKVRLKNYVPFRDARNDESHSIE